VPKEQALILWHIGRMPRHCCQSRTVVVMATKVMVRGSFVFGIGCFHCWLQEDAGAFYIRWLTMEPAHTPDPINTPFNKSSCSYRRHFRPHHNTERHLGWLQ
jgi:hypothetical protein